MYNGPSGPRISLTMTFSSAHAALATNIAPTAKQTILGALILILFRLAAARRNIYSAPTDAEGAHRLCIGVWRFERARRPWRASDTSSRNVRAQPGRQRTDSVGVLPDLQCDVD